ncbi:hypothetical protein GALMADRAFT_217652 [Galerina marginata CBS 339.88]|uniref:Uncharacterized protein n=1 Tax=Galerina marginata (strain CBS 339.88) TaxID=685588 RepID=A0A067S5L1_GALM3|nr:hypothetical protein GALMADRAFT_217652 [Galerina marginata CBS 339.88]
MYWRQLEYAASYQHLIFAQDGDEDVELQHICFVREECDIQLKRIEITLDAPVRAGAIVTIQIHHDWDDSYISRSDLDLEGLGGEWRDLSVDHGDFLLRYQVRVESGQTHITAPIPEIEGEDWLYYVADIAIRNVDVEADLICWLALLKVYWEYSLENGFVYLASLELGVLRFSCLSFFLDNMWRCWDSQN